MSKTPSNKLFKLIKSLSGAERRYFKVIANKKGDASSKYLVLFYAILDQAEFDEESLKHQVYDGENVQSRKFSELKGYLFNVVLKALQSYDEKSSISNKIANLMHNVDALFKRGHMQLCKDELRKAKNLSLLYEEFTTLYEILKWEKFIAHAMIDVDFLQEELNRIADEESLYLEQLNLLSKYRNIFLELYIKIKSKTGLDEISHIVESDLMLKENFNSHRTRVLYYRAKAFIAYIQKDTDGFQNYSMILLEVMESQPHFLKEEVSEYISALHNYCVSCTNNKDYEKLYEANEKIKTIDPLNVDDKIKIYRQYTQNFFVYCIRTGDFARAQSILPAHFTKIASFKTNIFDHHQFYFHYSYIYFGCEDYDTSLYHLNSWLDLPTTIDNPNLQMLARVFNLILHYELGNNMLLASLIKSTYRFLKKEKQMQEIEMAFITFIKAVIKTQGKRARKACFLKFKQKLQMLTGTNHASISAFDLMAWVDSKLLNVSFAEVVKNNLDRNK